MSIDENEGEKFFTDKERNIPDVEKILAHSIAIHASDIHLQAGKCITYRVEGVLVQMTDYTSLTDKHLDIIKDFLLLNHPKTKNDLENEHDADF